MTEKPILWRRVLGVFAESPAPLPDVVTPRPMPDSPIDTVPVHAFGRGVPGSLSRLDPELMNLDLARYVRQRKNVAAQRKQGTKGFAAEHLGLHLREPALDPAVERVVVAALVMRTWRQGANFTIGQRQNGMTPAPVTPAICHVAIITQRGPASAESIPFGPVHDPGQRTHLPP